MQHNTPSPMSARELPEKFLVAFSFAGEQRELVRAIAEAVEQAIGSGNVFFDEWFEHYLAGSDADLKLQEIYGEGAALVVVCISERYGGKPWTQAEHEAIRARVMKSRESADTRERMAVLPIRVGDGNVKGIPFNTIVPDIRDRTSDKTAELIVERLRLIVPGLHIGQKATPTPPGRTRQTETEPPILTFRLTAEAGEVRAHRVTPCASPALAVLTDEAELHERIDAKDFEVLLEALVGRDSLSGFRELARNCLGAAAPDRPEDAVLRLRVVAPDWTLAGLPWHCISHRGQPLGKAHWVIESIASGEAENFPVLEIPIENPLILAPSDPTLDIGAARHASQVQDALRALLGGRGAAVTWARTRQELEFYLQQDPPDLIYGFTCLDGASALTLGRSESDRHALRLEELAGLLERCKARPLVWMSLVAPRTPRPAWQTLLPHCRLLLVRQTGFIDSEGASSSTLAWLDRLQEGERTLSALASAEPDPRVTLVHSDAPVRLRLPAAEDPTGAALRARIRAALLRILLGREPEKNLIYGYVKGAHDGDLLAYVAVGDVQACAHDFPAQIRHRLEQHLDDGLRVVTQFIPARLRAASAETDIARLFKQHLLPTGGTLDEALERLVRHPPQDGESVVIALAWLLDLAADVSLDEVRPWPEAWTRFHAETLIGAVPDRCRVLLGACIALEAAGPSLPEQTAQRRAEQVLGMANEALDRAAGQVAVGFQPVRLEKPLGKLTVDHLYRFFVGSALGPRLLPSRFNARHLAQWMVAKTGGGFSDTVNLVYREYRDGYSGFQRHERRA